jgi:hypothetical protein
MSTPTEPEPELVKVFDTQQESEALVIQSLLESAGIESIVTNLQAPQDILPGVGGVIVRVSASRADEALSIIEGHRHAPAAEPDQDSNATPE